MCTDGFKNKQDELRVKDDNPFVAPAGADLDRALDAAVVQHAGPLLPVTDLEVLPPVPLPPGCNHGRPTEDQKVMIAAAKRIGVTVASGKPMPGVTPSPAKLVKSIERIVRHMPVIFILFSGRRRQGCSRAS